MPRCEHCGHDDLPVRALLAAMAEAHTVPILRVLGRIEKLLINEGVTMSEIDDRLDALTTAVSDLADDVDRELADLANALAGKLTPDEQAKFDSLTAKIGAIKSAVDTADPAPANPPTSEGDSTVPA